MKSGRSVNRLMLPYFTDVVTGRLTAVLVLSPLLLADGHVWLMPQNPGYQPILGDQCGLMGKVVATVHQI